MIFWSAGTAAVAGMVSLMLFRRGAPAGVVGLFGAVFAAAVGWAGLFLQTPEALSVWFLLPVLILVPAAAFHSRGYIKGHGDPGVYWGFFNLTAAAMLALPVIEDFLSFLIVWEFMGIFSAVLVMFDYRAEELKRVAWIYFLACEAGGLLLMLFYSLALKAGASKELICFLGMAGFGLKAGFPLLHLWLPEAHPAAPAPVSALMSGAMINLGFFGILKFAAPWSTPLWLGWTLLIIGCAGALGGIISALGQDNLKRLLAYSSIENMGLIALSLGCAFLGDAYGKPTVAAFGVAGAFLHLVNHALLKGVLFLGAGQIYRSAGTLSIDMLGGAMKRLPATGCCFTAASAGLAGLPPLNGFIGELMIYLAAFGGICSDLLPLRVAGIVAVLSLSLTGACALAVFAKAAGGSLLGEPRRNFDWRSESPWMYVPMAVLMALALLMVFLPPVIVPHILEGAGVRAGRELAAHISAVLRNAAIFSALLCILWALLFALRRLPGRGVKNLVGPTWDCGYEKPSARMAYTGSALIQGLAELFNGFLKCKRDVEAPQGLFPRKASFSWSFPDGSERLIWGPLFRLIAGISDRVHKFQSGYLHMYVLIMTIALIAMLAWAVLN